MTLKVDSLKTAPATDVQERGWSNKARKQTAAVYVHTVAGTTCCSLYMPTAMPTTLKSRTAAATAETKVALLCQLRYIPKKKTNTIISGNNDTNIATNTNANTNANTNTNNPTPTVTPTPPTTPTPTPPTTAKSIPDATKTHKTTRCYKNMYSTAGHWTKTQTNNAHGLEVSVVAYRIAARVCTLQRSESTREREPPTTCTAYLGIHIQQQSNNSNTPVRNAYSDIYFEVYLNR